MYGAWSFECCRTKSRRDAIIQHTFKVAASGGKGEGIAIEKDNRNVKILFRIHLYRIAELDNLVKPVLREFDMRQSVLIFDFDIGHAKRLIYTLRFKLTEEILP